jgi:LysM repeat protein
MKYLFTFLLLILFNLSFSQNNIEHKVKQGENLSKIAQIYDVSLNDIYSANPELGEYIYIDQIILIPITSEESQNQQKINEETNTKSTDNETKSSMKYIHHIVKQGETLSKIANLYNVSLSDIYVANSNLGEYIYIDQVILVPVYEESDVLSEYEKRECVRSIYDSQVGVIEIGGDNAGEEVEAYLASANLGKGNPWCASFVNWTFIQCGENFNLDAPGWVPSWFPKNKLIYVRGKLDIRHPQPGDLIGIWYQDKGRLAHIGFYDDETDDFIITVEGNTNESGSREGEGVHRKIRLKRTIHSMSSWLNE